MREIEYKKFKGLDNVTDRIRLALYKDAYMTIAENIDIDDDHKIWRRKSFESVLSGSIKNLWSNGSIALYVSGTSLKRLFENYSTATLYSGLSTSPNVRFADTPMGIYFTDEKIIGRVTNGAAALLPEATGSFKKSMPPGTILEYEFNKLYSIMDNVAYFSDSLATDQYDVRKAIIKFPGRVTMFKAVLDGFYVSAGNLVYFLAGKGPDEFVWKKIADSPAIEGTPVIIEGYELTPGNFGRVVMWASEFGVYLGGDGGVVRGLTQDHFHYDEDVTNGAAIYRDDIGFGQYLVSYSKEE